MSGPELPRRLQAGGHRLPIIFVTAHDDNAISGRMMQAGVVACLIKPFSEEVLLRAVRLALGEG